MKKLIFNALFFATVLTSAMSKAHDFKVADLRIVHSYAVASVTEAAGMVYFKSITNEGKEADQLIGAQTAIAESVELHVTQTGSDSITANALPSIALPAGVSTSFKHGQSHGQMNSYYLLLKGVKKTLRNGDRFAVLLQFKRSGEKEVTVWVQTPKADLHQHKP